MKNLRNNKNVDSDGVVVKMVKVSDENSQWE